jgi:hypothetical protein
MSLKSGLRDATGASAADQRWAEHMQAQQVLNAQLRTLTHLMERWLPQPVLFSGSLTIETLGSVEVSAAQPIRAVFVINGSGAALTVLAGRKQPSTPGIGISGKSPGIHTLAAGYAAILNGESTAWSFYGVAGGIIDVQCFSQYLAPYLISGGGGSSGALSGAVVPLP